MCSLINKRISVVLFLFLVVLQCTAESAPPQTRWVGSWAASQQLVEPHNSLPAEDIRNSTLRQVVHLSIGGDQLRLRLSNRFGSVPLHIVSAHIAKPVALPSSKIAPESDKPLTFSGRPDVLIPAGADYLSDPISFRVEPLSDLAITLTLDTPPAEQTGHPGSRTTSYVAHGLLPSAADLPNAKTVDHWYYIAGIDVAAPPHAFAVAVMGDSITDGRGSTVNGNNRWPDILARRLQVSRSAQQVAVLNHGIGGNRLLENGLGPNALARFDHDVLAQPGVQYLMILEGINDIGKLTLDSEVPRAEHDKLVSRVTAAYDQIIIRAHARGIKVIGCTILPFMRSEYYHPGPESEADRQAINRWIRTSGNFDFVIDLDAVMRDPEGSDRLRPAFDSGDHLHPSPEGHAAMGSAVPLYLFESRGVSPKVAITFDDLPAHSALPAGVTRVNVASKIVSALQTVNAPPIYGFINGLRLQEQPADSAVLRMWREAGYPLGNHTWSHMSLNQHTVQEFQSDTLANESVLTSQMKNGDWHWFRYPYLQEGKTTEERDAVRQFLAQHGYKITAVTMSFGDYIWNEPYARCRDKGDEQAIRDLEVGYLAAADDSITYYRGLSQTLYGRDIPYVLLMHIGAFDAEMMPRLLKLYEDRGFELVTLEEAQRDSFYESAMDLQLKSNSSTLERAMAEHGLPLPPRAPAPQLQNLCR